MTTQLSERLSTLRALLNEIVENAEKATRRPWIATDNLVDNAAGTIRCDTYAFQDYDAAFIAQSRTTSPQMARALIRTLDMLEPFVQDWPDSEDANLLDSILKEFNL